MYLHTSSVVIKSIKRELRTRPMYDCRCDERPEPKDDESTSLVYTDFVYYESIKTRTKEKTDILVSVR